MRVTPCRDPAKVKVAPNSPSERAKASTVPEASAGITRGNETRRNTVVGGAPRLAATSSYRCPVVASAPCRLMTRNGSETKVCASTTADVEYAMRIPAASR
ncbi:Uncharacterised protein [Mycobacteroides abscessus subsp. abscessus]|nr:Uncharacterised protein [Mycobacteroides abscessus subsp. abscessus]